MNEPMTCKDVLTSLVEYLGMTLMQWKDAYYIIDYEYIDNGYTDCTLFNIRNLTSSNTILPISSKNIMDIGVSSSNGSISLDSVYNKVTVVANTNAIGDLCPDLIDDDDLENQNSDPDKYYTQTIDDTVFLSAYFKSKENWETLQSVEEIDDSNVGNIYYGSFFQKQIVIALTTPNLHRWTGAPALHFAEKQWVNRGLPVAINYIHLI